ncbi:VTT domain-containing protein [Trichloromonas sp.]|uniref:VTT domain-containing protein n=1 Tax=Trichloromonas sp. TaxID=3069249 RepID=UPI003D81B859
MRLIPFFPFFLINLAAGLTWLPLRTFMLGTFFGIIPVDLSMSMPASVWPPFMRSEISPHRLCSAPLSCWDCLP